MKTPEEVNTLKEEALNKKLRELTGDELTQIAGGIEEGGPANRSWKCLECGAHGENLTASEGYRAVCEHMEFTNHRRIAVNL